jgi:hypothetical protein
MPAAFEDVLASWRGVDAWFGVKGFERLLCLNLGDFDNMLQIYYFL